MSKLQTTASRPTPLQSGVLASVGKLIDDLGPTATGELLDLFTAHVSQTIDRLHCRDSENSLAALGRIAHTMKGTAGCYGATELRETSSRLAIACKVEDRQTAGALLGQFEYLCQNTLLLYKDMARRCKALS